MGPGNFVLTWSRTAKGSGFGVAFFIGSGQSLANPRHRRIILATKAIQVHRLFDQSFWFDSISRRLVRSGELEKLRELGIRGVTSNPSIFQKAISSQADYDDQVAELAKANASTEEIYSSLVREDIRGACDILLPIYRESGGLDGHVSVEVLPSLADKTDATVAEARKLWSTIDRPNLLIKIPGTQEGFPAIEECIAHGISVNVTLLFSVDQYLESAEAYVRGLERRLESGGPLRDIASVASFFVSRLDTACDRLLDSQIAKGGERADRLESLKGKAGIANSKVAYEEFKKLLAGDRWRRLAKAGARPQRLLWASTSTKNPVYRDTLYVDSLIGRQTVNTIPPATWEAFLDHGRAAATLETDPEGARKQLARLTDAGINVNEVCHGLLAEGVSAFAAAMDKLLEAIEAKRQI